MSDGGTPWRRPGLPPDPADDRVARPTPRLHQPRSPADGGSAPRYDGGGRDARLDVLRGLALVMIFINHVPGTAFEAYTNRNFGFSDAAEAFVLMSGIAAGIAYTGAFRTLPYWRATLRAWGRSWTLYKTHIFTTALALGISAGAALLGVSEMIEINNIAPLLKAPVEGLFGIPVLGHQLGYFNILPLYAVLIFTLPLTLPLAMRRPGLLLLASIALWLAAGLFRLNFPNFPNPGGWFFNPFSWQLVFIIGLLTGTMMKQGRALLPRHDSLFWAAVAFLVFVLVWVKFRAIGSALDLSLNALREAGVPFFIAGFDKTFLAAPRLLHVLAAFYVIASLPVLKRVLAQPWAVPLALMGRYGLPVFATGSVLSILGQALRAGLPESPVLDTWIIGIGLALQLGLAYALWRLDPVAQRRAAHQTEAKDTSPASARETVPQ